MRLFELLAGSEDAELLELARMVLGPERVTTRASACTDLELELKSLRRIQQQLLDARPPSFAILNYVLDQAGFVAEQQAVRDKSMELTEELGRALSTGEILEREDGLRLYRRVFFEARRNEIHLDDSETSILAVLRQELGISTVEHFLLEHHSDFVQFWGATNSFDREVQYLVQVGVLFLRGNSLLLADEIAPQVRRALGVDMNTDATRRLYNSLPSTTLVAALAQLDLRISGSKSDRVDRLLRNWVQPTSVLRLLTGEELKSRSRSLGLAGSGPKEEVVERIANAYAQGRDIEVILEDETPVKEPRRLTDVQFLSLFASLSLSDLQVILSPYPELNQSGTKDRRAQTLLGSNWSEQTLLGNLSNRSIERLLLDFDLRLGGAKGDRVMRIISHFEELSSGAVSENRDATNASQNHFPDINLPRGSGLEPE
jgi:hypothetical protein